jgi:glycine/D-amino acid oxidase-like deaminating enzyme
MVNVNTFSPSRIPGGKTLASPSLPPKSKIAVVGAGAFGGWSALSLLRAGFNVTLVDAWGPGNARSSSGDESRVIRSTYGANEFYFDLNVHSLQLWKENQQRFGRQLFFNTGVLWFCYGEKTPIVDDSLPFARKHFMEYKYLSVADLRKRYPLIHTEDLHHAYLDPFGGFLKAREACLAVHEAFRKEGGYYIQAHAKPGEIRTGELTTLPLSNGTSLQADAYLFACGSWLGQLFPDVLGSVLTCTKQEVFYFGIPPGQSTNYESLPVWVDVDGKDFYYGIPNKDGRGFKLGLDRRGETFDPTTGDHASDPTVLRDARKFIEHRFPGLKTAPVVEGRVCPYENSPDGNFIFDVHPGAGNVWFLGGGSGHGFKHGPALGELVSQVFQGSKEIPPLFTGFLHTISPN